MGHVFVAGVGGDGNYNLPAQVSDSVKLTEVPRFLQALGRVDVCEGLLERVVIHARQAGVVEVVPGGYDEVDVQLLPDPPHLHRVKLLLLLSPVLQFPSSHQIVQ